MIAGLAQAHAEQIVAARGTRPFVSLADFARRTGLGSAVMVRLADAGAFDALRLDRRAAVWHALAEDRREMPLFDRLPTVPEARPTALPALSAPAETLADYRSLGLSLRAHPLSFLRGDLARRHVVSAAELPQIPNGQPVRVAGIVLVRQRPSTAKGITFVTLEDETGQVNLIIRMDVWNKFRTIAQQATLLLAAGRLQQASGVIHVLVGRLEDYSRHLQGLAAPARNFC